MAVFTTIAAVSAIAAVGAAVGTAATVAAVASAVVAVSAAVGMIGLAVTAVGLVTGNQDLMKVGEIMGYVGLAGGVAGGLIGGVGGMMSGGAGFMAGAKGAYTGAAGHLSKAWDRGISGSIDDIFNPKVAGGVIDATKGQSGQLQQISSTNDDMAAALKNNDFKNLPVSSDPTIAPGASNPANAPLSNGAQAEANAMSNSMAPTTKVGLSQQPQPGMIQTPKTVIPTTVNPGATTGTTASGKPVWQSSNFLNVGASGGDAASTAKSAFDSMPDWMKMAAVTSGMQGISGLASGWFQGASAEEQLEFQKLVNAQHQGQIQYQNKNNAYAPLLNFTNKPVPAGT